MRIILEESEISQALSKYISESGIINTKDQTINVDLKSYDGVIEAAVHIAATTAEEAPKKRRRIRKPKAPEPEVKAEAPETESEEEEEAPSNTSKTDDDGEPPFSVSEPENEDGVVVSANSKSLFA